MISNGRYLLSAIDGYLWRYDRKWRKRKRGQVLGDHFVEGTDAMLVMEFWPDELFFHVHEPDQLNVVSAYACFTGVWNFYDDKEGWVHVPEHVLVDWNGKRSLLRIADGAEVDPLVDIPEPTTVVPVPESRLVVLAGSGAVTVYDPQARHAGVRLKLQQGSETPIVRFRNGDKELWVNDGPTLIKFETANWEPIGAAESQSASPAITRWDFSQDEERVLILREGEANVVIADANTLDPIDTFLLKSIPLDVAEADDGKIFAVDARGRLPQARRAR